jgi:hypothetical protein
MADDVFERLANASEAARDIQLQNETLPPIMIHANQVALRQISARP